MRAMGQQKLEIDSHDPVFSFFFTTKSRARKRVYLSALKKAQVDQEEIIKEAREKAR